MSIDKSDLEKTLAIARLVMNGEDMHKIVTDVEKVLAYAQQLKEVDVSGVEPTFHMVQHMLFLREDKVLPSLSVDVALGSASEKESSFFSVPGILADT